MVSSRSIMIHFVVVHFHLHAHYGGFFYCEADKPWSTQQATQLSRIIKINTRIYKLEIWIKI